MNFLMHVFLSRENEDEMVGNFLGDFIKAGREKDFKHSIRVGILLHRRIDSFSEKNHIFKRSRKRFPKRLYRFSGIAVDIIYDHFLAKNFEEIAHESLSDFLERFYEILLRKELQIKDSEKRLINKIINENWLYNYRDVDYTKETICRVSRRMKRENPLSECNVWFSQFYYRFEEDFFEFLSQIEKFIPQVKKELL